YGDGSIEIWGCVTRHVLKNFIRIEGIMDCFIYVVILSKYILSISDHHNLYC
ncbi:hypothetical protein C8R44DRAFT_601918, partial [Mycena epipterygia]